MPIELPQLPLFQSHKERISEMQKQGNLLKKKKKFYAL